MRFKNEILVIILILFSCVSGEIGERNHKVPLFLSLVLPGGGQIYNGKYLKAGIYIALEASLIYGAVKQNERMNDAKDELKYYRELDLQSKIDEYEFYVERYKSDRNNFIWMSVGAVLLSAGDAFVDSHFKGFKRDVFKDGDNISVSASINKLTVFYEW